MDFDDIVIGSGINGLVAAAKLAGRHRKVLLLERSDRLGGCMISDECTLPGFTHDVMATTLVLFVTGPVFAELAPDLGRHGFELAHSPHPTAVLRPDGSAAVLTTDRIANIAAFNQLAPGDGDSHGRDVSCIEANAPLLFGLLSGELWSWQTARLLAREAWQRGPRGLVDYLGSALSPARTWLETTYSSPQMQALYAPWTLHCGLSPEDTYSSQMGKVVAFALEAAGAPIVKGGVARLPAAFQKLIEERGGTVRTQADVTKILVENGRAIGVQLANGEKVKARRSVIASVAPGQLYGQLLGADAPTADVKAARNFRHGRGNFQLHYALDAPPKWKTPGLDRAALIHLTDGIDAVSRSYNEAMRGLLPAVPTICLGQPAALDPSRCPEGKAILWLQIPDAPSVIKGDAGGQIEIGDGSWTDAVRESFADRLEAILAQHIDNFEQLKLKRRAYSPRDLEALNVNLVGGDPYGGACTIDQFFAWRPFKSSVNHRTAIKSLYHIGASTHPGPGLGGASGYLVAKEIG